MEMESVHKRQKNLETKEEENGSAELRQWLAREKELKPSSCKGQERKNESLSSFAASLFT
jgi:hypothetical protein